MTIEEGATKLMLPKSVEEFIRNNKKFRAGSFETIRVPSKEDLTGGWATFSKENAVPYATWGDFNGDGLMDVALILIGQSGKKRWWEFYAFHQMTNHAYQAVKMGLNEGYRSTDPPQQFYLTILKAGEKIIVEGKPLLYTYNHDSIMLSAFEGKPPVVKIFGWDDTHGLYHKTVLDRVGIRAAFLPHEADLPKVATDGDKKKLLLPKPLEMVIQEMNLDAKPSEVRIPTDEDIKGIWLKYKRRNAVPYATWGDFNGDGLRDVALILVDKTGGTKHWRAVAFLQTDNRSFEPYDQLERFNEHITGPMQPPAGRVFPPNPPQWYELVTAPAGSKRHYKHYTQEQGPMYRFDTLILAFSNERPIEKIENAQIYEWDPEDKWFSRTDIGAMAED